MKIIFFILLILINGSAFRLESEIAIFLGSSQLEIPTRMRFPREQRHSRNRRTFLRRTERSSILIGAKPAGEGSTCRFSGYGGIPAGRLFEWGLYCNWNSDRAGGRVSIGWNTQRSSFQLSRVWNPRGHSKIGRQRGRRDNREEGERRPVGRSRLPRGR